jgi:hypothetical protein
MPVVGGVTDPTVAWNAAFSRREPVAVFKRPGAAAIVWKQWFTKAPGEFVAEMLLVEKDGKYLVDHAMVF